MLKIQDSQNYKIAKVVFSKGEFNQEQVNKELNSTGVSLTLEELSDILEMYCDRGLISKIGNHYSVNS
ncbi:hypothetical protein LF817_12420 [Halobacillus sp. A1]|uniref:hypothetical protein n=1 Tax=Halobacillus sp. A1 TaxID=2880262 RepID=UPI0020A690A8|nr:hypothetical protein [Halobacillus sp. A1]MCP3032148.1 hypothetical protein [Halobacillus sp. A1]